MGKFSRKTKIKILGTRKVALIAAVLGLGCLAGLGYLWQIKQLHSLGKQIKASELKLDEVRQRREGLQRGFAAMCTHRELQERIRFMNLGLVPPNPDTMVRLSDEPSLPMTMDGRDVLSLREKP